jgi:3-oxoacyl-[acyl-carrier protein] reductase
MLKFANRAALITGASTGIGAATALRLARNGVRVAINYHQSTSEAERVSKSVRSAGVDSIIVQADVRNPVQVKSMVERTVKEFGRVDILVNNAGGLPKRIPIAESDDAHWNWIIDTNLRSVFNCSREIIPHMAKANYGRIVNVSSISAFNGGGRYAVIYAASKAGINAFTKGLAKELAPHCITVNAVAPGVIDTPYHAKAQTGDLEQFIPTIPLKRIGAADEVAGAIAYLASDDSAFVTGTVLHINGGQY